MKEISAYLTRHLGTKLLSLGIAFALWMILVAEQDLTTSWAAPVQYRNAPKDLEVSSDVTEKVQLDLRGPSGRIAPDQLGHVAVVLDLGAMTGPGVRTFPVSASNVLLPGGVALDRAVPSQVRLTVERRVRREVRVQVGEVEAPDGFAVASTSAEPASMTIVGPESVVGKIESVDTDPVSLTAAGETAEVRTQAHLSDGRARIEGGGAVMVKVQLRRK